jgi:predicted MFS family arabinose efflux permease
MAAIVQSTSMSNKNPTPYRVPSFIWTTILPARLLINAQFRIPYPFLPAISRGLGVPLEVASLLLTVRGLLGVTSPLFGYLSDRIGRKPLMLAGLLMLIAGAGLLVTGRSFGMALVAFALLGLAKSSYDPAMQAYVSDVVPYEHRGRALGATELSWSVSWLLAIPASGLLIAHWNWRTPFLLIALLALVSLFGTARLRVPRTSADRSSNTAMRGNLRSYVRPLLSRRTLLILAVSGLVILANENFFIIYGAWMETQFGLAPAGLGLTSVVVSLAELAAAVLSALSVDRLGKHRALFLGLAGNACAYLLLRGLAGSFVGALTGIILLAATSEFAIVSTLPLVSELTLTARGTVMAVNVALTSIAAAAASLVAPRLWGTSGLGGVTTASAACILLAALLLWLAVSISRSQQISPPSPASD